MTDRGIIKALKFCTDESYENCDGCPYSLDTLTCERAKLAEDSLDLINRQQKEVDRYERESNSKFDKWKLLDDRTKQRYAELYEEAKSVVRTEAIKEFAERLKKRQVRICDCFEGVSIIDIDKLVKEYEKGRQGNEFI